MALVQVLELGDGHWSVGGTEAIKELGLTVQQWTAIVALGYKLVADEIAVHSHILGGLEYGKIVHALIGGRTHDQERQHTSVKGKKKRGEQNEQQSLAMGPGAKVVYLNDDYVRMLAACFVVGFDTGDIDLAFKDHLGTSLWSDSIYQKESLPSAAKAYLSAVRLEHVGTPTTVTKLVGYRPLMLFLDALTSKTIKLLVDDVDEIDAANAGSCTNCVAREKSHGGDVPDGNWVKQVCRVFLFLQSDRQSCIVCCWAKNPKCSHGVPALSHIPTRKRRRTQQRNEVNSSTEPATDLVDLSDEIASPFQGTRSRTGNANDEIREPLQETGAFRAGSFVPDSFKTMAEVGEQNASMADTISYLGFSTMSNRPDPASTFRNRPTLRLRTSSRKLAPPSAPSIPNKQSAPRRHSTARKSSPPRNPTTPSTVSTPDMSTPNAGEKSLADRLEDIMDEVGVQLDNIHKKVKQGGHYNYHDRKLFNKVRSSMETVNELIKMAESGNYVS